MLCGLYVNKISVPHTNHAPKYYHLAKKNAMKFRIWSANTLEEYIVK